MRFDCLVGKLAPQKTSLVFCGGGQTATSKAFDSAVKGVGPFLVVIRERSTRHVFGFYSHEDFGAKSGWNRTHAETFLFTLGQGGTGPPTKLLTPPNTGSNGMHFGNMHVGNEHGGQLVACCSCATGTGPYNTVAPGYTGDAGDTALLSGTHGSYDADALEVFAIGPYLARDSQSRGKATYPRNPRKQM